MFAFLPAGGPGLYNIVLRFLAAYCIEKMNIVEFVVFSKKKSEKLRTAYNESFTRWEIVAGNAVSCNTQSFLFKFNSGAANNVSSWISLWHLQLVRRYWQQK